MVNERDGIGDNTPFEYATEVKDGGFYGWPWYYAAAMRTRARRTSARI